MEDLSTFTQIFGYPTAIIGICCCLGIFYAYSRVVFYKRTASLNMILLANFVNFLASLTTLLAIIIFKNPIECRLTQYLTYFVILYSLIWASSASILSYKDPSSTKTFQPQRFFVSALFICSILCPVESIVLQGTSLLVAQAIPFAITIFIMMYSFYKQIIFRGQENRLERFTIYPRPYYLMIFAIVQFLVSIPQITNSIISLAIGTTSVELSIANFFTINLAGVINAVLYLIFNERFKKKGSSLLGFKSASSRKRSSELGIEQEDTTLSFVN